MRAPGARGDRRGPALSTLTIVAAVVCALILAYLVYSLLRPEKF